jgi:fructose-1,6-bisphosphatase/inositol monophosphatase family enzyme
MEHRLQIALGLAKQAGSIIKENFGKNHAVELKADQSPVTEIDKQINTLVANKLRDAFPADGLLGEEGNTGSGAEQYQWICDPLDGTKPFILGMPNSVFMLGLSEAGNILLSVVYDPYSERMYRATKGNGAYCNERKIHVNHDTLAEGYCLVGADSLPYSSLLKERSSGYEPVSGTGFSLMMIARGYGVGKIQATADFHDIGPGSLIVEEAGGKVTGLNGEPLLYNDKINGAIISNGVAHDALVGIAREVKI